MAYIEPRSPEALAKAQKVRNIFYLIAILNIVFVAIIIWAGSKKKQPENPPKPPQTDVR